MPQTPLKTFDAFIEALGQRESSNDYRCRNKLGFLGRYQFGLARLSDFGLTLHKEGAKGFANQNYKWAPGLSEEWFLASPDVQDLVFKIHVNQFRKILAKRYAPTFGKTFNGVVSTLSGAIGVCHLLGIGGLQRFYLGTDGKDAFGTSASEYMKLFEGYPVPEDLPELPALTALLQSKGLQGVA